MKVKETTGMKDLSPLDKNKTYRRKEMSHGLQLDWVKNSIYSVITSKHRKPISLIITIALD